MSLLTQDGLPLWNQSDQGRHDGRFSLTLEAQVFPVVSVEGTVELGASQLLIDGLQHSAMRGVLAVQATCPKTRAHFLLGRSQGETNISFPEDGTLSHVSMLPSFLFSWPLERTRDRACALGLPSTHTERW